MASTAPVFVDYDAALAWIDERAEAYGGKQHFLTSEEYRMAHPTIRALYDADRVASAKQAKATMAQSGVAVGDEVVYAITSGLGMGTILRGKVFLKSGHPFVRMDIESGAIAGKRSVRWGPHWNRVRRPNPFTYEGYPEHVRDRIEQAALEEQIWRARLSEYQLRGDRPGARHAAQMLREASHRVACLESAVAHGRPGYECTA